MKHTINQLKSLFLFLLFLLPIMANAIPADSRPFKVNQPNGELITLRAFGDEFYHGTKTIDGYFVLQNDRGFYTYAIIDKEGASVPSTVIVRDIEKRTQEEISFLKNNIENQKSKNVHARKALMVSKATNEKRRVLLSKRLATNAFKGLVILVQFSDTKLTTTLNVVDVFTNQLNQVGYNYNGATGSVKDYFKACSMGNFVPNLTLAGPVTMTNTTAYYGRNDDANAPLMVTDACKLLDKDINFADYDLDKDGKVDMVYIVYAGYAESQNSTKTNFIWPHAYTAEDYNVVLDGVKIANYACSSELDGYYNDATKVLAGIGTICHEFSHVLGLPDMYDTDYENGGGQSLDPGYWSIMAGGCYLNESRTPPSYSAYERKLVGWLEPDEIISDGVYSLPAINTNNKAFFINAKTPNEAFYIENRQLTGWDKFLPGHGMLIFRVETTNTSIWENNEININPSHQYYELLRADDGSNDGAGNPFPGVYGVTTISDLTVPSLKTHAGVSTQKTISNITENGGEISFTVNSFSASSVENVMYTPQYYIKDNKLYLMNDSPNTYVYVYNVFGANVINQQLVLGWNEINLDVSGIYLVKVNGLLIKILI